MHAVKCLTGLHSESLKQVATSEPHMSRKHALTAAIDWPWWHRGWNIPGTEITSARRCRAVSISWNGIGTDVAATAAAATSAVDVLVTAISTFGAPGVK